MQKSALIVSVHKLRTIYTPLDYHRTTFPMVVIIVSIIIMTIHVFMKGISIFTVYELKQNKNQLPAK